MYRISLGERDFIGKARFCGFMVPNYFNSTLKNISDNNSCEKCFIQRVQKKLPIKMIVVAYKTVSQTWLFSKLNIMLLLI